jgi:hypothetical protein
MQNEMSHGELMALPVSVSVYTAGRAFGLGRDKTRQLAKAEQLPFPVVRLGQSLVVTRAALFDALDLDPHGAPQRRQAAADEPAGTTRAAAAGITTRYILVAIPVQTASDGPWAPL